jgi:phospholipase C
MVPAAAERGKGDEGGKGADQLAGNTDGLLGFRVPALLVSPFARREHVSHMVFDHASVLRTIEWRWDLPPLTVRDATAGNLAEALDFDAPRLEAKRFRVPAGPFGTPCTPSEVDKALDRVLDQIKTKTWISTVELNGRGCRPDPRVRQRGLHSPAPPWPAGGR